jgi:hypothetical protein
MTDHVLYERDGHIVTLTLNQPELRNPVSDDDMVDAILAALVRLENDPDELSEPLKAFIWIESIPKQVAFAALYKLVRDTASMLRKRNEIVSNPTA